MTERERFEAWASENRDAQIFRAIGNQSKYAYPDVQSNWETWQAALAASAPKVQMTDAEIDDAIFALGAQTYSYVDDPASYRKIIRAIAARSAPNAELVAALKEACDLIRLEVADGEHTTGFLRARAALAAVGEA